MGFNSGFKGLIPGPSYLDFGEQLAVSLCFDHVWLLTMCTFCPISWVLHLHVFLWLWGHDRRHLPSVSQWRIVSFLLYMCWKLCWLIQQAWFFGRPCHVFGFLQKGCHYTNWIRHTVLLPLCCLHAFSRQRARIVGVCNISQQTQWILCLPEGKW